MLLMFSLLPLLSGCDNEDDVIGIFTGKTWKLSRLTNKGSNAQFYPNLWNNNEEEMKKSLDKLYNQKSTFTLNFEGTELDGELMGTTSTDKASTQASTALGKPTELQARSASV